MFNYLVMFPNKDITLATYLMVELINYSQTVFFISKSKTGWMKVDWVHAGVKNRCFYLCQLFVKIY